MKAIKFVLLTAITILFILSLLVLSIKDRITNPIKTMTEEEALMLYFEAAAD